MPQMAPYNWLNLYFMFTLILMYLITYIYFISVNKNVSKKLILKKINYNWKW